MGKTRKHFFQKPSKKSGRRRTRKSVNLAKRKPRTSARKNRKRRVTRRKRAGGPKKSSCDVNKFKEVQRRLAEGPPSSQYSSMRKETLKQKDIPTLIGMLTIEQRADFENNKSVLFKDNNEKKKWLVETLDTKNSNEIADQDYRELYNMCGMQEEPGVMPYHIFDVQDTTERTKAIDRYKDKTTQEILTDIRKSNEMYKEQKKNNVSKEYLNKTMQDKIVMLNALVNVLNEWRQGSSYAGVGNPKFRIGIFNFDEEDMKYPRPRFLKTWQDNWTSSLGTAEGRDVQAINRTLNMKRNRNRPENLNTSPIFLTLIDHVAVMMREYYKDYDEMQKSHEYKDVNEQQEKAVRIRQTERREMHNMEQQEKGMKDFMTKEKREKEDAVIATEKALRDAEETASTGEVFDKIKWSSLQRRSRKSGIPISVEEYSEDGRLIAKTYNDYKRGFDPEYDYGYAYVDFDTPTEVGEAYRLLQNKYPVQNAEAAARRDNVRDAIIRATYTLKMSWYRRHKNDSSVKLQRQSSRSNPGHSYVHLFKNDYYATNGSPRASWMVDDNNVAIIDQPSAAPALAPAPAPAPAQDTPRNYRDELRERMKRRRTTENR